MENKSRSVKYNKMTNEIQNLSFHFQWFAGKLSPGRSGGEGNLICSPFLGCKYSRHIDFELPTWKSRKAGLGRHAHTQQMGSKSLTARAHTPPAEVLTRHAWESPVQLLKKVLGSVTLLEIPADLRYDLDVSLQDSPPSQMKHTFWFNNEQFSFRQSY